MCLLLNVGFGSLSVKGAAAGNTEQTSDPNTKPDPYPSASG